jgi:hypothetical protein
MVGSLDEQLEVAGKDRNRKLRAVTRRNALRLHDRLVNG